MVTALSRVPTGSLSAPVSRRRLHASAQPSQFEGSPDPWERPIVKLAAEIIATILEAHAAPTRGELPGLIDNAVDGLARSAYEGGLQRRGIVQSRGFALRYLGECRPSGLGWEFAGADVEARLALLDPAFGPVLQRGFHLGPRLAWTDLTVAGGRLLLDRLHPGHLAGHLDGAWTRRKVTSDLQLGAAVGDGASVSVRVVAPRMRAQSRHYLADGTWHATAGCPVCREEGPWARS